MREIGLLVYWSVGLYIRGSADLSQALIGDRQFRGYQIGASCDSYKLAEPDDSIQHDKTCPYKLMSFSDQITNL